MATTYTTVITVLAQPDTNRSAADVAQTLSQQLSGAQITVAARTVTISMKQSAEDASIAQLDARDRVLDALHEGGVDQTAAAIDEITVQANS